MEAGKQSNVDPFDTVSKHRNAFYQQLGRYAGQQALFGAVILGLLFQADLLRRFFFPQTDWDFLGLSFQSTIIVSICILSALAIAFLTIVFLRRYRFSLPAKIGFTILTTIFLPNLILAIFPFDGPIQRVAVLLATWTGLLFSAQAAMSSFSRLPGALSRARSTALAFSAILGLTYLLASNPLTTRHTSVPRDVLVATDAIAFVLYFAALILVAVAVSKHLMRRPMIALVLCATAAAVALTGLTEDRSASAALAYLLTQSRITQQLWVSIVHNLLFFGLSLFFIGGMMMKKTRAVCAAALALLAGTYHATNLFSVFLFATGAIALPALEIESPRDHQPLA